MSFATLVLPSDLIQEDHKLGRPEFSRTNLLSEAFKDLRKKAEVRRQERKAGSVRPGETVTTESGKSIKTKDRSPRGISQDPKLQAEIKRRREYDARKKEQGGGLFVDDEKSSKAGGVRGLAKYAKSRLTGKKEKSNEPSLWDKTKAAVGGAARGAVGAPTKDFGGPKPEGDADDGSKTDNAGDLKDTKAKPTDGEAEAPGEAKSATSKTDATKKKKDLEAVTKPTTANRNDPTTHHTTKSTTGDALTITHGSKPSGDLHPHGQHQGVFVDPSTGKHYAPAGHPIHQVGVHGMPPMGGPGGGGGGVPAWMGGGGQAQPDAGAQAPAQTQTPAAAPAQPQTPGIFSRMGQGVFSALDAQRAAAAAQQAPAPAQPAAAPAPAEAPTAAPATTATQAAAPAAAPAAAAEPQAAKAAPKVKTPAAQPKASAAQPGGKRVADEDELARARNKAKTAQDAKTTKTQEPKTVKAATTTGPEETEKPTVYQAKKMDLPSDPSEIGRSKKTGGQVELGSLADRAGVAKQKAPAKTKDVETPEKETAVEQPAAAKTPRAAGGKVSRHHHLTKHDELKSDPAHADTHAEFEALRAKAPKGHRDAFSNARKRARNAGSRAVAAALKQTPDMSEADKDKLHRDVYAKHLLDKEHPKLRKAYGETETPTTAKSSVVAGTKTAKKAVKKHADDAEVAEPEVATQAASYNPPLALMIQEWIV